MPFYRSQHHAVLKRVLLLLTLLLSINSANAETTIGSNLSTPNVISAAEFELADYRGQFVYLDFWATWCGPCKASFPWMKTMQTRFAPQGLNVIAISVDQEPQAVTQFLAKYQPNFQIVTDPESRFAKRYKLLAMPSSFLIGPDGNVIWTHKGFRKRDIPMLEEKLQAALQAAGAKFENRSQVAEK